VIDLKRNASVTIYEALKEKIMDYTLKPGQRLIERDLAKELGMSRTPIREAIHRLEKEGLVIVETNKGAYIAPISAADMAEIYQIRMVIEAFAGMLVAPYIMEETLNKLKQINEEMILAANIGQYRHADEKNDEFHTEIYKGCNNKRLYDMIIEHWNFARRLRTAVFSVPGRMKEVYDEHEGIIEALSKRDQELVEKLIRNHLVRAQEVFHKAVEQKLVLL